MQFTEQEGFYVFLRFKISVSSPLHTQEKQKRRKKRYSNEDLKVVIIDESNEVVRRNYTSYNRINRKKNISRCREIEDQKDLTER